MLPSSSWTLEERCKYWRYLVTFFFETGAVKCCQTFFYGIKYTGKVFCLFFPVEVCSKGCSDQWKFFWEKCFPFLHSNCFLIWRFWFNGLNQILRRLYHLSTNITCVTHYRWQGLKHNWNQCLQWNLFACDSMMWPEIMSCNRDYQGDKLKVGHIS